MYSGPKSRLQDFLQRLTYTGSQIPDPTLFSILSAVFLLYSPFDLVLLKAPPDKRCASLSEALMRSAKVTVRGHLQSVELARGSFRDLGDSTRSRYISFPAQVHHLTREDVDLLGDLRNSVGRCPLWRIGKSGMP